MLEKNHVPSSWMGSAGVQQSKSYHRFSIGLRSGLWLGHSKTFKCFPLNHSSVALAVCLGLSMSCWKVNLRSCLKSLDDWNSFPPRISLYLAPSFNSDQFPSPCRWKTSPQHDAATTMLHCRDDVLEVMIGVGFAPDIAFSLMAKKLHFSLIWPEYLLPYVCGVSNQISLFVTCAEYNSEMLTGSNQ